MAEVWLAERDDGVFRRRVALKLMFRHVAGRVGGTFAQRFARERDILASLHHPNIAVLFDAGVTPDGQPWLALEYVEGETLAQWCDDRGADIAARVRLFRQVLLAVQHAHANLVIHRDLKPGNILVTPHGEVRLLDFGIAKLIDAEGDTRPDDEVTRISGPPMTLRYAAPEQLCGEPLTSASDVYALGAVLYELLCGLSPYELGRQTPLELERAVVEIEPRPPSKRLLTEQVAAARSATPQVLRRKLEGDLDAIVLRALAKRPQQRYRSVEALQADLDRWAAGEPVLARVPSKLYRCGKFVRRHRLGVGLAASGAVALIAVTVVAAALGLQAREDSARASAARNFMLEMFGRAAQQKARGADITARDLLESGHKDLRTRLSAQPRLQAELLQGIAGIQKDMGEYADAASTFADAAAIYARLRMPHDAALALTAEANAAVRMGRIDRAESALRAAAQTVGSGGSDAGLDARMSEVAGWVAVLEGKIESARAIFRRCHELALQAFGSEHPKTLDALRGRIYVEQRLQAYDSALELLRQLEASAAASGQVDARERVSLAVDRAELLKSTGRERELLAHLQQSLARCASDVGPHHVDCRELSFRKSEALVRLALTARAAEDLPVLESMSTDPKSPEMAADARLLILSIESALGTATDVQLEQVRDLATSGTGLRPLLRAKAWLTLAKVELRAGRPESAARSIAQARAIDSGTAVSKRPEQAIATTLEGICALQREQAQEALARLFQAKSEWSALVGSTHPKTYLASLNVAVVLDRIGRESEALKLVEAAEPALRPTLGSDSPLYLRVRQLRDRIESRVASQGRERAAGHPASVVHNRGELQDFFI